MTWSPQYEGIARVTSDICGWLYFLAWSLSFYPQPFLNLHRRTTTGLTLDFPLLNVVGFTCYTISAAVFLSSPVVRAQYAQRHPLSPIPTVRFNDLAFGIHAWILCVITLSQFLPSLWGWRYTALPHPKPRLNKATLVVLVGSLISILTTIILTVTHTTTITISSSSPHHQPWEWIDVIYTLTYTKLLLTISKYIPQALLNFRRRSTLGWSAYQVLLDTTGGVLSLLQLVIDSALQEDWSGLWGNPVKWGLAGVSLLFDGVFLVQHYSLYGPVEEGVVEEEEEGRLRKGGEEGERSPLLSGLG